MVESAMVETTVIEAAIEVIVAEPAVSEPPVMKARKAGRVPCGEPIPATERMPAACRALPDRPARETSVIGGESTVAPDTGTTAQAPRASGVAMVREERAPAHSAPGSPGESAGPTPHSARSAPDHSAAGHATRAAATNRAAAHRAAAHTPAIEPAHVTAHRRATHPGTTHVAPAEAAHVAAPEAAHVAPAEATPVAAPETAAVTTAAVAAATSVRQRLARHTHERRRQQCSADRQVFPDHDPPPFAPISHVRCPHLFPLEL